MDDLPEWGIPFIQDKFTGPYWSDGRFQKSVANSTRKPKSKLEAFSKRHDAQYAQATTDDDLLSADLDYYENTRGMGVVPNYIGEWPIIGNALFAGDEYKLKAQLGMEKIKTKRRMGFAEERMKAERAAQKRAEPMFTLEERYASGLVTQTDGTTLGETTADSQGALTTKVIKSGQPVENTGKVLTPSTYNPYDSGPVGTSYFPRNKTLGDYYKRAFRGSLWNRLRKKKGRVYSA